MITDTISKPKQGNDSIFNNGCSKMNDSFAKIYRVKRMNRDDLRC